MLKKSHGGGGPLFRKFADLVTLFDRHLGRPSEKVLRQLHEKARSLGRGIVTVHELQAGFTRFEAHYRARMETERMPARRADSGCRWVLRSRQVGVVAGIAGAGGGSLQEPTLQAQFIRVLQ
jgi:hypothetical protein